MEKIKALTSKDALWQSVIEYADNCTWKAGKNLAKIMKENKLADWERVFVVLKDDVIAGFCTLSKKDCISNVEYTPYVSFVFVDEAFRGNRISERLCINAISYAKSIGFDRVYLVSDHINLYEKYGFERIDEKEAPWGAMETIFMRST